MGQAFRRSLRFDARHPEDWVAWGLRAALLLTGLAAPFAGFDAFLAASLTGLAALGLVLMGAAAAVEAYRPRLMRLVEASLGFLFLMNWVGHFFGLYGGTAWFDVTLHAVGGLLGGLCGYWVARATPLFWLHGEMAPFRAFWVALSAALVVGALFEVAEFAADELMGADTQETPDQTPHEDTMTDIMAEAGTSLVVALGAAWWTRRRLARKRATEGGDPANGDPTRTGKPSYRSPD